MNIIKKDLEKKDIKLNEGDLSFAPGAYLDIIFTRPNPRAVFCYRTNIDSEFCDDKSKSISNITITISNGNTEAEKTKNISVQNTGQISIQ